MDDAPEFQPYGLPHLTVILSPLFCRLHLPPWYGVQNRRGSSG
jgi:hypothetical protein